MASSTTDQPSSNGFFIFAGLSTVLAVACIAMYMLFSGSSEDEILNAVSSGQRLTISAATGEISGTLHSSEANNLPEVLPSAPEPAYDAPKEEAILETMPEEAPSFDVGGFDVGEEEFSSPTESPNFAMSEEAIPESIRVYPRTSESLVAAPAKTLIEKTALGYLPKTGSEGTPLTIYSRPFVKGDTPLISILVIDLGLNQTLSESAYELPNEISFSFSPYGLQTKALVESARNLGHEVWLHLPMQPSDYPASDPGPYGLLKEQAIQENGARLMKSMASFSGYVGVSVPINEVFSESKDGLGLLMKQLKERGLGLVYSHRTTNANAQTMLKQHDNLTAIGDLVIDLNPNPDSIKTSLGTLEKIARAKGSALGIAYGYPITINALRTWADTLSSDLELAPVSASIISKQ